MAPLEELQDKRAETDFSAALCGLTILRYLSDHLTALPLGLMSRLLSGHDAVMALLPLVESPPWVRSRKGGKVSSLHTRSWGVQRGKRLHQTDHTVFASMQCQSSCLQNSGMRQWSSCNAVRYRQGGALPEPRAILTST